MGYEGGKRLGKNLQGRSMPVEAHKLTESGAIGLYGEKAKQNTEIFKSHREKLKSDEQLHNFRKTGAGNNIQYAYQSAGDGKSRNCLPNLDNHIAKTKVIDMTGPKTQVLINYHAIGGRKTIFGENEEFKNRKSLQIEPLELMCNLQLCDRKMEEHIQIKKKGSNLGRDDIIVPLCRKRKMYVEQLLERNEADLSTINKALILIEELEINNDLSLDKAYVIMSELKTTYSKIYYKFKLAYRVTTYVIPLFKKLFSHWQPLEYPLKYLESIISWQKLLENKKSTNMYTDPSLEVPMEPFHRIIWETWVPVLRFTIMNEWNPKDWKSLLLLMDAWRPPILPLWIHTHILHDILLPKITLAMQNWDPQEDTVPIHIWLHPWLSLMGDYLVDLYPDIYQKMSSALIHWHPSDCSAKIVLQPWKHIFSDVSMYNLIQYRIQPKLENALLEMQFIPNNQNLDPWHWFCDWEDLLPVPIMINIIKKCFFPSWYRSLGMWLNSCPAYVKVIDWYIRWRDLMPVKASSHLHVREKFKQALEISRRALEFQPGASKQFSFLLSDLEKIAESAGSPRKRQSWSDEMVIKSVDNCGESGQSMQKSLEKICHFKGILFMPIPDRILEGRRVYICGKNTVSFLKDEVFIHTSEGIMDITITSLLDETS